MSSDEAISEGPPTSPLRNSSDTDAQSSVPVTPVKRMRYGRRYGTDDQVRFAGSFTSDEGVPATNFDATNTCRSDNSCSDSSSEESDSDSGGEISSAGSVDGSLESVNADVPSEDDIIGGSDSSDDSSGSDDGVGIIDSDDGRAFVQKLFSGSERTTDEAVLSLMDCFVKKRWPLTTLKDVLGFCSEFFPSNMPSTVHRMFSYLQRQAPSDYSEIEHFYCSDCLSAKEKDDKCPKCNSDATGVFFELPVSTQIRHFFEHRDLATLIDAHRYQISDDNITDITSSNGYKALKRDMNGQYDITLQLNTDGVSLVKSSQAHLYPVLATINELPPHLRSGYMLVCGLWYDVKSAPVMNNFLEPLVNELINISENKIEWTHPTTRETVQSLVVAPILCADAVARSDVLVMQHHNGKYGCNGCEIKTKRFDPEDGGKKMRRYLFNETPALVREKDRMDRQGRKAIQTGHPVRGVKGEAVVSRIPFFDRASSAGPEYMHTVLLGVVKHFLKLWFEVPGDWCIKDKVTEIDKFIVNQVEVTDQFANIPKPIKDRSNWKASDYRAFLLFFSLPALSGYLPEKYFQHFMLLVDAIYTLLKQKITEDDVVRAEIKLRIFVRDVGKLYRLRDYLYNVHNLLHLGQFVRKWGPLWATSAFPFESFNYVLGRMAPGTKHKGKQIVKRIKIAHGVEILRSLVEQTNVSSAVSDPTVLGQEVPIALNVAEFDLPVDTKGYLRASVKKQFFTSRHYDEGFKRSNSYVCCKTQNSVSYGQILYFYEKNSGVYCLLEKFKVQQTHIFIQTEGRFRISHLIPVCLTNEIVCAPALSLEKLTKAGKFLCIRPNSVEKNL